MPLLAILVAASVAAAPCPGDNTLEIEACLQGQLDAANKTLGRYETAARKRLKDDGQPKALAGFNTAERQWVAYAKTECDAVYDYWSEGTIRGTMELNCEIDLTVRHTHTIWSDWLTYMDSTPPILPEPLKEPAP